MEEVYDKAQGISERKLLIKVATVQEVITDEVDKDGAICRTKEDTPQIDGNLFIDKKFKYLKRSTH